MNHRTSGLQEQPAASPRAALYMRVSTGRQVEQPNQDNDVRSPLRTDFPHLGAILAHHLPAPRGLPGFIAIPELATRSSIDGQYKRVRELLRGGGGGFLGPLVDSLLRA